LLRDSSLRSLLAATILIVVLSTDAFAQSTDLTSRDSFQQGQTEVGMQIGFNFAMDLWGGLPDSEAVSLGLRLGRVITKPIAPGPLRGNLHVATELHPVLIFHDDSETAFAVAGELMLRDYFAPGAKVRPFISAGGGIVLSNRRIPRGISKVNFTPQGGGGVAVTLRPGTVLSLEYRIHHMSDGVLTTYNPGVNSSVLLVGVSWVH